jgi:hypothetical protein
MTATAGLPSPIQQISAGPRRHSRSWFRVPLAPMTILLFFPEYCSFWNWACSSRSGGVWNTGHSHLMGTNSAGSHSLSLIISLTHWITLSSLAFPVGQYFKLLLTSVSIIILGFTLLGIHDMHVSQNGASSSMSEGTVFQPRRYVCCTVVSARVYPRCHGVQVLIDTVHPLSLHYTK